MQAQMVTIDCAEPRKLAQWWLEALGGEVVQDFDGHFVMARVEAMPLMLGFQRVPEPKSAKNRAHLDFASEDRVAEVERLLAMGAERVEDHDVQGFAWTTLRDPDGNEFCVSQRHG